MTDKEKQVHHKAHHHPGALRSEFDPNGSYTGTPADSDDKPTQDADDL